MTRGDDRAPRVNIQHLAGRLKEDWMVSVWVWRTSSQPGGVLVVTARFSIDGIRFGSVNSRLDPRGADSAQAIELLARRLRLRAWLMCEEVQNGGYCFSPL